MILNSDVIELTNLLMNLSWWSMLHINNACVGSCRKSRFTKLTVLMHAYLACPGPAGFRYTVRCSYTHAYSIKMSSRYLVHFNKTTRSVLQLVASSTTAPCGPGTAGLT